MTEATTLVDIENPHRIPRSRDPEPSKHRAEWVNSELDDFFDQGTDDSGVRSVIGIEGAMIYGAQQSASVIRDRLGHEWDKYWMTDEGAAPDRLKLVRGITTYLFFIVFPLGVNLHFIFGL